MVPSNDSSKVSSQLNAYEQINKIADSKGSESKGYYWRASDHGVEKINWFQMIGEKLKGIIGSWFGGEKDGWVDGTRKDLRKVAFVHFIVNNAESLGARDDSYQKIKNAAIAVGLIKKETKEPVKNGEGVSKESADPLIKSLARFVKHPEDKKSPSKVQEDNENLRKFYEENAENLEIVFHMSIKTSVFDQITTPQPPAKEEDSAGNGMDSSSSRDTEDLTEEESGSAGHEQDKSGTSQDLELKAGLRQISEVPQTPMPVPLKNTPNAIKEEKGAEKKKDSPVDSKIETEEKLPVHTKKEMEEKLSTTPQLAAPPTPVAKEQTPLTPEMAKQHQAYTAEKVKETKLIADSFKNNLSIDQQRKIHDKAKTFLTNSLAEVGSEVRFISPPQKKSQAESIDFKKSIENHPLDRKIFTFEYTDGVLGDIKKAGQRANNTQFVFGVASQFNGCEAPSKECVRPGNAVNVYRGDRTQGPQAQLAFSESQVELINCGGSRKFNGLCRVLDQETITAITNGYLTPDKDKGGKVVQQLKNEGHKMEYLCVKAIPNEGEKPVYQILVAAPAFGLYANTGEKKIDPKDKNELEFLCALHGYRAQFAECIRIAKETGDPVAFKAVAVGAGVFGNNIENIAKAFHQAAIEYTDELRERNVKVDFQIYSRSKDEGTADPKALEISKKLKLTQTVIPSEEWTFEEQGFLTKNAKIVTDDLTEKLKDATWFFFKVTQETDEKKGGGSNSSLHRGR